MTPIPFNVPSVSPRGQEYLRTAAASGHHSGDGPFTKRCHDWLERRLGVNKVLLTTSCTHALEMSALLLDIQPGDEVIVPSFTFVSTLNAFVLRGARPVFVDIRPDTLNIDERLVRQALTHRTRAIVPVHYAGVGCEMDSLMDLAVREGIPIIEDNAHGLFGEYRHKPLGTFGSLATLSFHETKNVSCGEGGALIVNDPELCERAEIIREKGTNRSRFFRGQVDKYSWVDVGSSYLPSDLLAAVLLGNLEESERTQTRRKQLWKQYTSELGEWAGENGVQMPRAPTSVTSAYHLYYLLLPSLADRTAMIAYLKSQGIQAVFHYLPLHLSEMGRQFGGRIGDCPVTESVSDRLLRLPFHANISANEARRIVEAVKEFQCKDAKYVESVRTRRGVAA